MKTPPVIYPPSHRLPTESFDEPTQELLSAVVSDAELVAFITHYTDFYRKTVEEFFPQIAAALPFYARAPFHTTVVRMGPNAVIVGHKRSSEAGVEVKQFHEITPLIDPPNVLVLVEQLEFESCWFDGTPNQYNKEQAELRGVRDALSGVLDFFWQTIPDSKTFERICRQLMVAEGLYIGRTPLERDFIEIDRPADLTAKIVLNEPAGFRRLETWWFQFKHYKSNRISVASLREAESIFVDDATPHVLCLVTSENLTSIGTYIASENPRVRIWDRSVLDLLVNRHLSVLRDYFNDYPKAVSELTQRLDAKLGGATEGHAKQFIKKLVDCPTGKLHFSQYESIGIEILQFLFTEQLGGAKPQERTLDGKQRRDVLFRNNRTSRFFDRLFHRFGCDFLIVDFKNYGKPIEPKVITDVEKYANRALGKFMLVVSRKSQSASVDATQVRMFRDSETIVLVVSDNDLIEMMHRKETGLAPEDVLEDKLDELLRNY